MVKSKECQPIEANTNNSSMCSYWKQYYRARTFSTTCLHSIRVRLEKVKLEKREEKQEERKMPDAESAKFIKMTTMIEASINKQLRSSSFLT